MDLETIRELINAFQQLGGDAKEVFVWYLVVAYLPTFVIGLILSFGGIWLTAKIIETVRQSVRAASGLKELRRPAGYSSGYDGQSVRDASNLKELRRSAGYSSTYDGEWRLCDWRELLEFVTKHRDELGKKPKCLDTTGDV